MIFVCGQHLTMYPILKQPNPKRNAAAFAQLWFRLVTTSCVRIKILMIDAGNEKLDLDARR